MASNPNNNNSNKRQRDIRRYFSEQTPSTKARRSSSNDDDVTVTLIPVVSPLHQPLGRRGTAHSDGPSTPNAAGRTDERKQAPREQLVSPPHQPSGRRGSAQHDGPSTPNTAGRTDERKQAPKQQPPAVASATEPSFATQRSLFSDGKKVTPSKSSTVSNSSRASAQRKRSLFDTKTPEEPKDSAKSRLALVHKIVDDEYLLNHNLDQLRREQEKVSAATAAEQPICTPAFVSEERKQPEIPSTSLSAQQRLVAEHPPDTPLAVRAGAGTGKTQTMVTRAVMLPSLHEVDPAKILMLTFTNRAAGEMRDRIGAEFAKLPMYEEGVSHLPTVKTFHSLAYHWVRIFWKHCGLGRYPRLLVTNSEQKGFMKEVILSHLKQLQLNRCIRFLDIADRNKSGQTWESVLRIMQQRHPKEYKKARENAEEVSKKPKKNASKVEDTSSPDNKPKSTPPKKKKTSKQLAAERRKEAERELLLRSEIQRQCYLELRRLKAKGKCNLETRWKGDLDQCKMYLKLVENARLGQHQPAEYLPWDAEILQRYEEAQEQTGKIDFDKMLQIFVKLLQDNEFIAKQFHGLYDYVIVDEYQDNSEVQTRILSELVSNGRVTVVGDDDQCIYEFRGAFPGNFKAFSEHYSSNSDPAAGAQTPAKEVLLEDNYRSTGNILKVGGAFLEGSHQRSPKTLRPTREAGEVVHLWQCNSADEQAKRIAKSIKRRHEENGVSWGQTSCLFRCFKMGAQPPLHIKFQHHFSLLKIPYQVIGGQNFLKSAMVCDITAYLSLSLTGTRDRVDDEAFSRVLNKPPRRLGPKVLEMIKKHRSVMDDAEKLKFENERHVSNKQDGDTPTNAINRWHSPIGLEEASKALMRGNVLSDAQTKALKGFFDLIHDLRVAAIREPLTDLMRLVWKSTGLSEWHAKKAKVKSESGEAPGGEESSGDEGDEGDPHDDAESPNTNQTDEEKESLPTQVQALVAVAEAHMQEWTNKILVPTSHDEERFPSLVDLARGCLYQNTKKIPQLPQECLPQVFLDQLEMPGGIGLPVVNSFLADLALQMTVPEEGEAGADDDRVTISTVHRAKGLEWNEVYAPFFNEGYMPTSFREGNDNKFPSRHRTGCRARDTNIGRRCNLNCASYYAKQDAERRGLTPEQQHSNEERRIAHVAATRAKDRLVFVSIEIGNRGLREERSSFEASLDKLPQSVFQNERLG